MSDSRSNQIIPKLEKTSAVSGQNNNKSPHTHNGDGSKNNLNPRHQGSWCWLLAQDGSPATVAHPYSGNGSKNNDSVAQIDIKEPPEVSDNGTTKSDARNADATTCENKKPRDPANCSRGGSRWCWLLAQDGTHATVDTKNTTINTNTTVAVFPSTETSAEERTSNPLVCGSWHWLLAPDGSPAMVGTKTEEEAVESGTRSSSSVTETTSEECKRRRGPVAQHSWHWLLAPDGSPATAERSTVSRVATGGKRKRGAAPEGERHASGPKPRSYPRTDVIRSAESFEFETDDEHSSCETVDEDDCNWINKHQHTQWKEKFQLLVEYKNKHKTTRVPYRELVLGKWVADQRNKGRSGRLTKYRRQCLESLGFEFDVFMPGWMEMYNRLLQYKEQHNGSLHVPYSKKRCNKHLKLAKWVYQQRVCFDTNRLSDERKNLLESIGFGWQLSKKGGQDRNAWMEMYQRLRVYKEEYKSTRVPEKFKADPKLANWVLAQRRRCKEKYRIDLLNYIGFERNPKENDWIEMYQRLLAYRKRYQNTRVPRSFQDSKLAKWVDWQRHCCSEKKRVELLNDIGFEWKIRP